MLYVSFVGNLIKFTLGVGALLLTLSVGERSAKAVSCTTTNCGVVFVHGTGDYTASTAVSSYWTQASINTMRGSYSKYLVVGYNGMSKAGFDAASYGSILDQIYNWTQFSGVQGIVVVTHSNGSNPIRYAAVHYTGLSASRKAVVDKIRKIVEVAGDNRGTVLADKVTTSGSLLAIGNGVTSFFGNNWNGAAVWQQRRDRMGNCTSAGGCTGYNGDGTFGSSSTCYGGATACAGKPVETIAGNTVYAAIWSSDAHCGGDSVAGYWYTAGLKATLLYAQANGGGSCSDGFVPCDSAKYHGTNYMDDSRLNHNQSRRSCRGSGSTVNARISSTTWTTAIPSDYTIAPGAQACNSTVAGDFPKVGGGTVYQWGCTTAQRSDATTDIDCYSAYGGDNGYVAPAAFNYTGYSNSAYYAGSVCPDSWLGDGECDMCLLAKYGYDSKTGSAVDDDCVNKGAGFTNKCGDILWDYATSSNKYYSYTVTH